LVVMDDGTPNLSATQEVVVLVNDFLALGLGGSVIRTQSAGCVPMTAFSSAGVVDLQWTVCYWPEWLTNFTVVNQVGVTTLSPLSSNCLAMSWAPLNNPPLLGTRELAGLCFMPLSNRSAFVPLLVSDIVAVRNDGLFIPRVAARDGRVVVVGAEPLLEALLTTNGQRVLNLYGIPGTNYAVEVTPILPATWQQACLLTMGTNLVQQVCDPLPNLDPTLFFRAVQTNNPPSP
jgi:hypothetical protein